MKNKNGRCDNLNYKNTLKELKNVFNVSTLKNRLLLDRVIKLLEDLSKGGYIRDLKSGLDFVLKSPLLKRDHGLFMKVNMAQIRINTLLNISNYDLLQNCLERYVQIPTLVKLWAKLEENNGSMFNCTLKLSEKLIVVLKSRNEDIILAVNVLSELSLLFHELNPTFSLLIYSTVFNIMENNKEYIEDELKELKIFILTNCIEQLTALRKYGMMAECLKVLQKLLFGDEYLLSKVYELFYAILSSSGLPEYLCTFENINGTNTHYMPVYKKILDVFQRIVYESHNGNAEWFEIRRSLIEKSIIDSFSLLPHSEIRFLNFNANILKRVLDKIQEVTKRGYTPPKRFIF